MDNEKSGTKIDPGAGAPLRAATDEELSAARRIWRRMLGLSLDDSRRELLATAEVLCEHAIVYYGSRHWQERRDYALARGTFAITRALMHEQVITEPQSAAEVMRRVRLTTWILDEAGNDEAGGLVTFAARVSAMAMAMAAGATEADAEALGALTLAALGLPVVAAY